MNGLLRLRRRTAAEGGDPVAALNLALAGLRIELRVRRTRSESREDGPDRGYRRWRNQRAAAAERWATERAWRLNGPGW